MLQKFRGVILAPLIPPGGSPAGPAFVGWRRADAAMDTPRAVPAVVTTTGTVIGAGIVCLKV